MEKIIKQYALYWYYIETECYDLGHEINGIDFDPQEQPVCFAVEVLFTTFHGHTKNVRLEASFFFLNIFKFDT